MSTSFSIGEVAIVHSSVHEHWNGCEVTIISGLQYHLTGFSYYYEVAGLPEIGRCGVAPRHLRKKPPKRDDLSVVRWADCPWQPEKVRV